jgi:hypothetical protein
VDDFSGMVQGNPGHRQHVKHIFLSSLDEVLRQLDNQDNVHRQELASVKKVLKGDATWVTLNIVLGWLLDSYTITIQLTPNRVARLFEILDSIAPKQHHTTVNKCKKLLGELRSMVLAIPRGNGLFSVLQDALQAKCDQGTSGSALVRGAFGAIRLSVDCCGPDL